MFSSFQRISNAIGTKGWGGAINYDNDDDDNYDDDNDDDDNDDDDDDDDNSGDYAKFSHI